MKPPALIRGQASAASLGAAGIGAVMLGIAADFSPAGWPVSIATGNMPLSAAAAEGVLILAYLLALDRAETRLTGATLRWASARVPVLAAGLAAASVTAASVTAVAAAAALSPSVWLAIVGPAAAGAVLLVAVI